MIELAEILRQYGSAYRAKFRDRIPASHLKVMQAIEQCRTAALGGHVYTCEQCQETRYSYHSCKNRHCPKCQNEAGQQRLIYDLLFQTSAAAWQQLAYDPRFVGGQIGFLGVLQTWTRDLAYHPHVHYLVPDGGLSAEGQSWLRARNAFFVHVKPLSRLFRAKFRAALAQTDLLDQVPASVWRQDWVVHCQPVGTGEAALKYLAPYVFRVALSNQRLLKLQDGQVTFRYRDSATRHWKTRTLPAEEFIRRFLQHILPQGFQKVRYYGFFSSGQRHRLQQVRQLLGPAIPPQPTDLAQCQSQRASPSDPPGIPCPTCGRPMRRTQTLLPPHCRSP